MLQRSRGFTLIELLIVVAIIGLLASIAVPTFLNAIHKGRQKRTMADMRSLGSAFEEYHIDQGFYPRDYTTLVSMSAVATLVQGPYLRHAPVRDGWGFDIVYGSDPLGEGYTVRSPGKDGVLQPAYGTTTDFDCDIVFQEGTFTAFPRGVQVD